MNRQDDIRTPFLKNGQPVFDIDHSGEHPLTGTLETSMNIARLVARGPSLRFGWRKRTVSFLITISARYLTTSVARKPTKQNLEWFFSLM